MDDGWGFVIVGYVAVFGGLIAYAVAVIARGRSLAKKVPAERRRFLD